MESPGLNLTSQFYTGASPSLLWEMTVCQSLGDGSGPCAECLNQPRPYGHLVADFLSRQCNLPENLKHVVEVGGGYGTLMAAFREKLPPAKITQVDLSPKFLQLQKERLGAQDDIEFIECDIFTWLPTLQQPVDLLIANEIIGDLPTFTNLSPALFNEPSSAFTAPEFSGSGNFPSNAHQPAFIHSESQRLFRRFGFDINSLPQTFNLNYGALLLLEKLAEAPVRRVFITEHSADDSPPYPFAGCAALQSFSNGYPRQIILKDHDEYSIRFSHLEKAGRLLGFKVLRFHLYDLLEPRFDDQINYLLGGGRPNNENEEIYLEFLEHAAEYQGLILEK